MIKMAITFKRKQGMSVEAFRAYRRDVHAPLLFSIPEGQADQAFCGFVSDRCVQLGGA